MNYTYCTEDYSLINSYMRRTAFPEHSYVHSSKSKIQRVQARKRLQQRIIFITVLTVLVVMMKAIVVLASPTQEPETLYKYYTSVQISSGDTLTSIAQDYVKLGGYESTSEYIKEVVSINHLSDKNHIRAGQKIVVPYYSSEYH